MVSTLLSVIPVLFLQFKPSAPSTKSAKCTNKRHRENHYSSQRSRKKLIQIGILKNHPLPNLSRRCGKHASPQYRECHYSSKRPRTVWFHTNVVIFGYLFHVAPLPIPNLWDPKIVFKLCFEWHYSFYRTRKLRTGHRHRSLSYFISHPFPPSPYT